MRENSEGNSESEGLLPYHWMTNNKGAKSTENKSMIIQL